MLKYKEGRRWYLDRRGPWLAGEVPLSHIMGAALEMGKSLVEIVTRLRLLNIEIEQEVFPHELEIIIQIGEDCSHEEAAQRLRNAGWTPKTENEAVAAK